MSWYGTDGRCKLERQKPPTAPGDTPPPQQPQHESPDTKAGLPLHHAPSDEETEWLEEEGKGRLSVS